MGKVPLTQKFRDILTYQHQLNVDDTFYIQGDETSGIKTSTKQLQILPQTGSTQVLSPYGTNFNRFKFTWGLVIWYDLIMRKECSNTQYSKLRNRGKKKLARPHTMKILYR